MEIRSLDQTFSCEWSLLAKKLHRCIYSVRPAALASFFKSLIRSQRGWVVTNGIKLKVDPISHFGQEIITTGTYEPIFSKEIISNLKPGDFFLDIGANEGFFSLLAAQAIGPDGRVFAVEPQSNLVSIIQENSKVNRFNQIEVFQEAFCEVDGEVELNLSHSLNSGASSLFRRHSGKMDTVKVKSERFDHWWLNQSKPKFNVVKIDCEGAELFVIRSAKKALEERFADLIFLDFHESIIGPEGVEEIDTSLREAGYELSELHSGVWCYHLPSFKNSILKERIRRPVPVLTKL